MNRFLQFIKLVDPHDGNLSLTNVALIIVLIKLAVVPTTSIVDVGALLLSLASYQGKKLINKASNESTEPDPIEGRVTEAANEIEALKSKVNALTMKAGITSKY